MRQHPVRAATLALVLGAALSTAQAAPVTYNFTAEVSYLNQAEDGRFRDVALAELAGSHLAMGEKLVGSITYDAAVAQFSQDWNPGNPGTEYLYGLPTYKLEYASPSGGFSISTASGSALTMKDASSSGILFQSAYEFTQQGYELLSYSRIGMGGDAAFLSSLNMPASINTSIPNFLGSFIFNGFFRTTDLSTIINYEARVTSFSPAVSAVPEPGTYAMLLAGLGVLGVAARRQRSNHSL